MPPKLGILAGGGTLPSRIIAACRESGRGFFVIAFPGQTESATVTGVPHAWVKLGAVGEALSALRREGVQELVFAGPVRRPSLSELKPDFAYAHYFAGLAYQRQRQLPKTADHFDAFLRLAPDAPERAAVAAILRTIK